MKWLSYIFVVLLVAATIPTVAQRGGERRQQQWQPQGKVLDVTAQQAKLVLYLRADSPDAPGKVPDEFAAQAANLEYSAAQAEDAGNQQRAQMLRDFASTLRCIREVEQSIGPDVPLTRIDRLPLGNVKVGTRLGMNVSADGDGTDATLPTNVTLLEDARPVGPKDVDVLRAMPRGPRDTKTFYHLIGTVATIEPLTMTVNDTTVKVANPKGCRFPQPTTIKLTELQKNQWFAADVQLDGPLTVKRVLRLTIREFPDLPGASPRPAPPAAGGPGTPPPPGDARNRP